MARKTAGEATEEETRELNELLGRHPELQYAFEIVSEVQVQEGAHIFTPAEEQQLLRRGLDRLAEAMEKEERRPLRRSISWKKITAVAASLAILVSIFLLTRTGSKKEALANEVVTRKGTKTSFTLPDGTSVVLNAGSRLAYDAGQFMRGRREVSLSGEALFDVRHDPAHPFLIHTDKMNIRVLGTVFNVKAYKEDATIETTLISGKIEVDIPAAEQKLVLQPAQKLVISRAAAGTEPASAGAADTTLTYAITGIRNRLRDTTAAAAPGPAAPWTDNRLEFENTTLEQLARDLERWFDVTIYFKNDKYKREVFSGAFKHQKIEDVLEALQLSLGCHYQVQNNGKTVYIW